MAAPRKVACVEIGGIPIALSTDDDGFLDLLRRRYDGFLSSSRPEFELDFDLISTGPASDDDVQVRRNADGNDNADTWLITRGDLLARWDPRTGRGTVRQNANPYSLDSVLRILHSLILAERGGFLLHAASAICHAPSAGFGASFDGRAYLFSGVSGAGKTTMTRLAPPDVTLLTDEISYVRPDLRRVLWPSALLSPESWLDQARIAPLPWRRSFSWSKGRRTASTRCPRRKLFAD